MKKIACFVLMVLILTGCSEKPFDSPAASHTADPCSVEKVTPFLDAADDTLNRFNQLAQNADEIPGKDLESIIKEMQVIETEAEDIDLPLCALKSKAALTSYMGTLIQGYFRLYSQGISITPEVAINRSTAEDEFNLAASKLEHYETEREALINLVSE